MSIETDSRLPLEHARGIHFFVICAVAVTTILYAPAIRTFDIQVFGEFFVKITGIGAKRFVTIYKAHMPPPLSGVSK
jgi:hypothetical protein